MRDLLFFILAALIVVAQCETIFFTNSPKHLIGAKNVTSYKLLVKDSDPITIIEANKEADERPPHTKYHERNHASDRIDVNLDEGINLPKPDYHVKLLANMGGSHHVDIENTQNMHGSLGFTVTGGPAPQPNPNDFERRKSDQETDNDSNNPNAKKVVYSPILLKKFMQEYAEKLKNADNSVKSEIQKIHEKINKLQTNEHDITKGEMLEFDKSIEAAEQKFNLNGYRDSFQSDRFKHQSQNSYKDKDGWVTLEAVPWSSSSVSKWYPHGSGSEDTRRRPAIRPLISKPDKFPWHDDTNDDYFNRPKPANIDRDSRPGVYSMWTKPNPMHSDELPRPKPYKFSESNSFGSHNKYHDNDHDRDNYSSGHRPWSSNQADIITDNRPSSFPSESYPSKYHDGVDRYHTTSSRFHSPYQDRPTESNGDWVLISTTKGYQYPPNRRQQGKRALSQSSTKSSVISVSAPQSMRMHKAIRLSVLPALDPAKNTTFSIDSKRKPTTSHGGMIEVDSTHETVEDDVRATLQANKKLATAKPVQGSENKNRKLLKGKSQLESRSS